MAMAAYADGSPTGQAQMQVQVPDGLGPGEHFIVGTPDGQTVQLTVPEGVGGGQAVTFFYTPLPAQPATVIGQPIGVGYGDGFAGHMPPVEVDMQVEQDRVAGQIGWMMYLMGWCVCCFCPFGCGPIFWLAIACMHYSKPSHVRRQRRQEAVVAAVALATSVVSIALIILFLVFVLVPRFSKQQGCDQLCSSQFELLNDTSSCNSWGNACFPNDRRRRRFIN